MPCNAPLTAYYSREVGASGKRGITFDRSAAFSGVKLRLPCGQCAGCRLEASRQWAIRCMHEKQLHEDSVFVTLTYDDDHLPQGGTLVKKDLSAFVKRLHNRLLYKRGRGVRFYACGEYGETTYRPHYHALLFDCDFADKKFYKVAKGGERLYRSELLRELWPYGLNVIGSVTFESAAYVARYIMDKRTGDGAAAFYERVDSDGVVYQLQPEFTNMSRRPGIGAGWFAKFGVHAYEFDSVVINGREVRPPRFYDGRYEVVDANRLAMLKLRRRRNAMKYRKDNTVDRRRVREVVLLKRLAMARREPS